jgi:hypothetical protein
MQMKMLIQDGNHRKYSKVILWLSILTLLVVLIVFFGVYKSRKWSRQSQKPTIELYTDLITHGRVSLDLKSAFVFRSTGNNLGYIFFTDIYDDTASYTIELFEKKNSKLISVKTKKGKVVMGQHTQNIRCEQYSFVWQFPIHLYVVDKLQDVAVIPIADISKIKSGNTDFIKWTKVI